jgi:type IV pilus biogenesis protein CpaD/CtpE
LNEDIPMMTRITLIFFAVAGFAACAGTTKTATEADFGNSVASMIKAQAANPAAASNPSTETVTGVDPDYADNVIEAMRESVSKPAEVKQPIEIRVGGQGGT